MFFSSQLKKTVFISAVGHIALFGIFSFSLGYRMPKIGYVPLTFWGAVLKDPEIRASQYRLSAPPKEAFLKKLDTAVLDRQDKGLFLPQKLFLKPQSASLFNSEKIAFLEPPAQSPPILKRNEPAIVLHPLLPYGFALYFNDRQVAHMELAFRIEPLGQRNSITLKRKISSGNLEVDLLSMRYIWHYLFIQQGKFSPNSWQTVKIDLSEKDR